MAQYAIPRPPSETRPLRVYAASSGDMAAPTTAAEFAGPTPHTSVEWCVEPPAWVDSYGYQLYERVDGVVRPTAELVVGGMYGVSPSIKQEANGKAVALRLLAVTPVTTVGTDPFIVRYRGVSP